MSSTAFIVMRPDLKIGSRTYLPGDLFERDKILRKGFLNEAQMEALKDQGYYEPLTQERLDTCLVRRPGGSPPVYGLTPEVLADAAVELRYPSPPKMPKDPGFTKGGRKTHKATHERPERVPVTSETVEYHGYRLTPRRRGGSDVLPPLWAVTASDGTPVREAAFASQSRAKDFIDDLLAKALENDPAADNSGSAKESGHGGDVQSSAD